MSALRPSTRCLATTAASLGMAALVLAPGSAAAKVVTPTLDQLIDDAELIVLGTVEEVVRLDAVPGVALARLRATQVLKGAHEGGPMFVHATPTFICDTTHFTPGEEALVFLRQWEPRGNDAGVADGRRRAIARHTEGRPVYRILVAGRGKFPVDRALDPPQVNVGHTEGLPSSVPLIERDPKRTYPVRWTRLPLLIAYIAERQRGGQRERALAGCARIFDAGKFHDAYGCLRDLSKNAEDAQLRKEAGRRVAALEEFAAAYDRGMGAVKARVDPKAAIRFLIIAETGARAASPGGRVHGDIRNHLADAHYLQGREDFDSQRYAPAFDHWSKAVDFQPGHKYALDGFKDLERLANDLYLSAYIQVRENLRAESIRGFRKVLSMTRKDSELNEKARQRLKDLGEAP